MLREVRIRNLAVIRELTAEFSQGLHVITGETGAGKSILLHAMSLLSGARANRSMIREGAGQLLVEGIFSPPEGDLFETAAAYGLQPGEELVLSRTVQDNGRSAARIQGQLVTLAELKAIGEQLIDVYGQKDRTLLEQDRQLGLLDSFLTGEQKTVLDAYRRLYENRRQKIEFVHRYGTDPARREREADLLRYQIEEIEAFNPFETDLDSLETEHRALLHAEELRQMAEQMHSLLSGWSDEQPGAQDFLTTAESLAHKMEGLDSSFAISEPVTEILEQLRDITHTLSGAADRWQMDPERLAELDQRIGDWMRLQRKYGQTKEEVIAFYNAAREEYRAITGRETELAKAEQEIEALTRQLTEQAEMLRGYRREIGRRLDAQMIALLDTLLMPGTAFETRFTAVEPGEYGADRIVFYIRTNQGQAMQPLHEIASGGELSRVMLAIRSLFSREFASSTVVFDEIDTGVSGRAAQAMAEFLHRLSGSMQILAVTHLPQIAAMGDAHSLIEKQVKDQQTFSTLIPLGRNTRADEVARLISGSKQTTSASAQAAQLLDAAAAWKRGGTHGLSGKDH